MQKSKMISRLVLSLVALGLLAGCSGQNEFADLKAKMKAIQAKPHGHIEPPPEIKQAETYTYDANQLRAPFTVPKTAQPTFTSTGKSVKPDFARPKEYLERFDLDTLSMVGTISNPETGLEALIHDPTGNVTRVKLNDHIGENYGKIVKITATSVGVMEIIPDGRNGWVQRPRTLQLSTATN